MKALFFLVHIQFSSLPLLVFVFIQNQILNVKFNRHHDRFRSSKVREEKPRFLRGLVHYNASIPQLVKTVLTFKIPTA